MLLFTIFSAKKLARHFQTSEPYRRTSQNLQFSSVQFRKTLLPSLLEGITKTFGGEFELTSEVKISKFEIFEMVSNGVKPMGN